MPAHRFVAQFGPLSPYRPWRKDSARTPWRHPASAAERLYYLGFIYLMAGAGTTMVVVPDEVRAFLPARLAPGSGVSNAPGSAAPDLILDLAHFLAYLHGQAVRPVHGRWLAPVHCCSLSATLMRPDELATRARSELQTGYLRFLHYLAEVAGFVAPTLGWLKPTPVAWRWLEADDADRYRDLLQGWANDLRLTDADQSLWTRYRWSGQPAFMATLLNLLDDTDAGTYDPVVFASELRLRAVADDTLPADGDVDGPLKMLLAGPLGWMGWASLQTDGGQQQISVAPTPWNDSPGAASVPLTTPVELRIQDDVLDVILPSPPARPELLPLVTLALPMPDGQSASFPSRTRHLTRMRCAVFLSHGLSTTWIAQQLSALALEPIPRKVLELLQRWDADIRGVSLRHMVVLTTADPTVVQSLAEHRGLRPLLYETLSPHHTAINPAGMPRLLSALHRDGHTPLVTPEVEALLPDHRPQPLSPAITTDPSTASYLWLALRVLYGVADLLALPNMPPVELLQRLADGARAQLPALEVAAGHLVETLQDAIDGYTPHPAPLPNIDVVATRQTLEEALARDRPAEIVYHTAGRGERTVRVVEPMRLETLHSTDYLIAYCRLRQDERVFRLDRIERATIVEDEGESPVDPEAK